jgi:hypothetical protein
MKSRICNLCAVKKGLKCAVFQPFKRFPAAKGLGFDESV